MQVRAFFYLCWEAEARAPAMRIWCSFHIPQSQGLTPSTTASNWNKVPTSCHERCTSPQGIYFRFVSIYYCQAQVQYIFVTEFKVKSWVYLDKARCICFIRLWVDSDIKVSLKKHWENRVSLNHVACWLNIHSSTLRRTSHFFPIGLQNPQNQYFWRKLTFFGTKRNWP